MQMSEYIGDYMIDNIFVLSSHNLIGGFFGYTLMFEKTCF